MSWGGPPWSESKETDTHVYPGWWTPELIRTSRGRLWARIGGTWLLVSVAELSEPLASVAALWAATCAAR